MIIIFSGTFVYSAYFHEISIAESVEGTLLFVEQKRTADFIASFLCQQGFKTTSIHGDRFQSQREEALADFKAQRMAILVATSVAARGLGTAFLQLTSQFYAIGMASF